MRIDPALQRRGFGTPILDYLEARAPEPGFERLVLDATDAQPAALASYESHGYRETGREPSPAGEIVYFEKRP
jgi:ribosomal protein S18 acetylase RimI-like enzyme